MKLKITRILLIVIVMLLSFSLGALLGMSVARADEPERIGIFTQPDGTQIIEICYDNDTKCEHETVSWEKIENILNE